MTNSNSMSLNLKQMILECFISFLFFFGAMFLLSYIKSPQGEVPVLGLPGCVMYAKRTIFDLLLPRLLADDAITAEDIARLGEGGLCLGCAECHWPNCGFGHC